MLCTHKARFIHMISYTLACVSIGHFGYRASLMQLWKWLNERDLWYKESDSDTEKTIGQWPRRKKQTADYISALITYRPGYLCHYSNNKYKCNQHPTNSLKSHLPHITIIKYNQVLPHNCQNPEQVRHFSCSILVGWVKTQVEPDPLIVAFTKDQASWKLQARALICMA